MFVETYNAVTISKKFVFAVILLVQCFSNGAAIKCFVCDSSDNPSCADLKSNSSIVAEECNLEKMKSINTWIFELNEIAYFDTGLNRSPLMICQKVVARDPSTREMVTARFCQLDTADSDACSILQSKLRGLESSSASNNRNNNNNANERRGGNKRSHMPDESADGDDSGEQQFHCSVCRTDRCNGSGMLRPVTLPLMSGVAAFAVAMIMQMSRGPV